MGVQWMVNNTLVAKPQWLAMEQEYTKNVFLLHTTSHLAWCVGGCWFTLAVGSCVAIDR